MMRTDQSVRDLTEKHRYARATGDERNASRYKKMMASFGVAARFEGGRQQKHIVEFTGLSLVDIDHIAPERMTEVLEKVREDEHTLLAYTTLSGQGVRVLTRYEAPLLSPQGGKTSATMTELLPPGGGREGPPLTSKYSSKSTNITRTSQALPPTTSARTWGASAPLPMMRGYTIIPMPLLLLLK